MTAIAFVAAAATNISNGPDDGVTTSVPSGTVAGNVMIAFHLSQQNTTPSGPAGWTQVGSNVDAGTATRMSMWWRVATDSEPANYTWHSGAGASSLQCAHILTYSGVYTANPIQVSGNANSTTAEALDTGNIVTTSPAWIVSAIGERDDDATVDTHTTSDGSDAERTDSGVSQSGVASRQIATYDSNRTVDAGTHSRALTTSAANTTGQVAFIAALNPAPELVVKATAQAINRASRW